MAVQKSKKSKSLSKIRESTYLKNKNFSYYFFFFHKLFLKKKSLNIKNSLIFFFLFYKFFSLKKNKYYVNFYFLEKKIIKLNFFRIFLIFKRIEKLKKKLLQKIKKERQLISYKSYGIKYLNKKEKEINNVKEIYDFQDILNKFRKPFILRNLKKEKIDNLVELLHIYLILKKNYIIYLYLNIVEKKLIYKYFYSV